MTRRGTGRKKISIRKIEDESHLQVTYSKRRAGLFKKASELCTLCNAQIAIIIFSPGNKVYSFGHLSLFLTINKYLTSIGDDNIFPHDPLGPSRMSNLNELNKEATNADEDLHKEQARKKKLTNLQNASEGHYWWDTPDKDKLTLDQLELLKAMKEELYNDVQIEKKKISFEANNNAREGVTNITTSVDWFEGVGYVPTENAVSFDPMAANLFNPNNIHGVGPSGTNFTNPFDPYVSDGAGPSGTKSP
ncbi:MADS box transcription factor [Lithospermum erythrorhizon]|uniref:MADS box transcription factor n=1 Tax=Lithospermum erythrorhizon TaxID=34254 RepID=A0AAV3NRK8_LITER